MARREVKVKICDRPHRNEMRAVATRQFLWFGTRYQIDVCEQCDADLKAALDPWIADSRQLTQLLGVRQTARLRDAPARPEDGQPSVAPIPRPGPEADWTFTQHALEQAGERDIDMDVARQVAAYPEMNIPSAKTPGVREHIGRGLIVVVEPEQKRIITVVHGDEHQQVAL